MAKRLTGREVMEKLIRTEAHEAMANIVEARPRLCPLFVWNAINRTTDTRERLLAELDEFTE